MVRAKTTFLRLRLRFLLLFTFLPFNQRISLALDRALVDLEAL
jgi:hypothetical protein